MKSTFNLEANIKRGHRKLTLDGQEVPNVASVTLTVPARGLPKLHVEQVAMDGTASGEAEVKFVRRLFGSPRVPTEPVSDEVKDSIRELGGQLLARAAFADVAGGGTVTLEDGRKAHYLYVIDPAQPFVRSVEEFGASASTPNQGSDDCSDPD